MYGKAHDREYQISIPAAKNLKLAACMFKMIEHCSRTYDNRHVCSTTELKHQHQWELEQKKQDSIEAPKEDKIISKTMENIVLYLKLMKGVREVPSAYMVHCHVKVALVPSGYNAYLNLDQEMIATAFIVDKKLNFNKTWVIFDRTYPDYRCDISRSTRLWCIKLFQRSSQKKIDKYM